MTVVLHSLFSITFIRKSKQHSHNIIFKNVLAFVEWSGALPPLIPFKALATLSLLNSFSAMPLAHWGLNRKASRFGFVKEFLEGTEVAGHLFYRHSIKAWYSLIFKYFMIFIWILNLLSEVWLSWNLHMVCVMEFFWRMDNKLSANDFLTFICNTVRTCLQLVPYLFWKHI